MLQRLKGEHKMADKKEEGDKLPLPPSIRDDIMSEKRAHLARNMPRRLEDWHQFLTSKHCKEYPVLAAFEEDWQWLNNDYQEDRGGELAGTETNIIDLLVYYTERGMYPPPEVILTIVDLWDIYVAYKGSITLEEIFITGMSKPKAGNLVIQKANQFQDWRKLSRHENHIKKGCTQIEAATKIKSEFHMKAEEESIVRMMRKKANDFDNPYVLLHRYMEEAKRRRD